MRPHILRITQLALLLVGFGLRIYRLDFQELRGDEVFGYLFSLRPWGEIVSATLALQEPHPVASYFVEKGWLLGAGQSEFALRFASVWFSVLAIALLYRLARALQLDLSVATVALALMALSPYAIWHAQDARMYSMSLALTTASSWLAVAWLYADRRRGWLAAAYVIVSLLALHTHYFAAFVLVAHYLFMMGVGIWRRAWRRIVFPWLLIQGAVALLYAPWLLAAAETLTGYGGNGDSPGLIDASRRALLVLAAGESVHTNQQLSILWMAALLLLLGTLRLLRNRRQAAAAFLLLYLFVPLGATWLSAQQRPIFDERYLVAALPPCLLLMAAVLQPTLREEGRTYPALRLTSMVLLGALAVSGLFALNRYYTDPDYSKTRGWRELAVTLDKLSAGLPPDAVRIAQNFPDPTLWYYYTGPVDHVVLPPGPNDAAGAAETVAALRAEEVQRVLLPVQPASNWDDANLAGTALSEAYELLLERQIAGWPVAVYAAPAEDMNAVDTAWENGVQLAGFSVVPDELAPGGVLTVALQWQERNATLRGTEKVFVQLLGPDGGVVTQDDRPLAGNEAGAPRLYGLDLPDPLPPGAYRLIVGLYDPDREGVPRLLTQDGADHVELQTWEVGAPAP